MNTETAITTELEDVEYQGRTYRLVVAEVWTKTGEVTRPYLPGELPTDYDDEGNEIPAPTHYTDDVMANSYRVLEAYEYEEGKGEIRVELEPTEELEDIARLGIEAHLDRGGELSCDPKTTPETQHWTASPTTRLCAPHDTPSSAATLSAATKPRWTKRTLVTRRSRPW